MRSRNRSSSIPLKLCDVPGINQHFGSADKCPLLSHLICRGSGGKLITHFPPFRRPLISLINWALPLRARIPQRVDSQAEVSWRGTSPLALQVGPEPPLLVGRASAPFPFVPLHVTNCCHARDRSHSRLLLRVTHRRLHRRQVVRCGSTAHARPTAASVVSLPCLIRAGRLVFSRNLQARRRLKLCASTAASSAPSSRRTRAPRSCIRTSSPRTATARTPDGPSEGP